MSRKTARENAFRLVYEYIETGERNDLTRGLLCANDTREDAAFTEEIYTAVIERFDFLKDVITKFSKDFAFDRIYKTDLAALFIASYEILFRDDVPQKVAVNEALELSKKYSTEKSAAFVNGILSSVISHKEELLSVGEDN